MEQYIPKAAVVAEIENLLDKGRYHEEYDCAYRDGNNGALYALKNKIDTLEVKEVQEEPVSEELIDATNNYCVVARKGYPRVMDKTDRYICNAFKAGANWQKEQMMKDVVEATLLENNMIRQKKTTHPLYVGDKVKLIIVKDD